MVWRRRVKSGKFAGRRRPTTRLNSGRPNNGSGSNRGGARGGAKSYRGGGTDTPTISKGGCRGITGGHIHGGNRAGVRHRESGSSAGRGGTEGRGERCGDAKADGGVGLIDRTSRVGWRVGGVGEVIDGGSSRGGGGWEDEL